MKKRRFRLPALRCNGWAVSFWSALLFVVTTPMHLPAQEHLYLNDHDCRDKALALPDNPHLIVRFTADPNVPLSEPPIRECKFGVEITDQRGKVVGHWGPVVLSAPPVREIRKVHNRDIILIGAGRFFLLGADEGNVKDVAFFEAEKLESFQLHNGDLQIVVYEAYDRYDELPNVFRFDGMAIVPDEQGKKAVLERIVRESAPFLENTSQYLPTDLVHGLAEMMKLRKACIRVLRAQAVLGDAAYATQLCEKARKEIFAISSESCLSNAPHCMDGTRDTEISLIDNAIKGVMDTEPYRRLSSQPKVN